jgi:lipopolysaccharide transport system permease protein
LTSGVYLLSPRRSSAGRWAHGKLSGAILLQAIKKIAPISALAAYLGSARDFAYAICKYRRLLAALARRDLSEDYVNHGFSLVWTVIQPLFSMAVYVFSFTLIFPTRVDPPAGFPTNAVVYLLAGITPWMILCQIMGKGMGSIVGHSSVVKQMAFPLELLPTKAMASPLFFGAVALSFLVLYTAWVTSGGALLVLIWGVPLLILITLVMFTGIALVLGSFEVFIRDTREFVSMFTTIGFFTHPILYLPNAIPEVIRPALYISPFTYFLMCWQDIFFYGGIVRGWAWVITIVFAVLVFVFGARVFMASKQHFGDFL